MKLIVTFLGKLTEMELNNAKDILDYLAVVRNEKYDSFSKLIQPLTLTTLIKHKYCLTKVDFTLDTLFYKKNDIYYIDVVVTSIIGGIDGALYSKPIRKQEFAHIKEAYTDVCNTVAQKVETLEAKSFYSFNSNGNIYYKLSKAEKVKDKMLKDIFSVVNEVLAIVSEAKTKLTAKLTTSFK